MSIQITRLRDLLGALAGIEVLDPIAIPTGPKTIADDDPVDVAITLPGGVRIEAQLTAAEYMQVAKAHEQRLLAESRKQSSLQV